MMRRFYLALGLAGALFGAVFMGAFFVTRMGGVPTPAGDYIEVSGAAEAPAGVSEAQAKALARRGAMADLQRSLLKELAGLNVDSSTAQTSLQGLISGVEALDGEWDGKVYRLKGRVRVGQGYLSGTGHGRGR